MFKLNILYFIIISLISFNKAYSQQGSQLKNKIVGNWYYLSDVYEIPEIKDYNEIYFDENKVQEYLEAAGLVYPSEYKIEGDSLLIKRKNDFLFSGRFESISKNQFILIKNGFKRIFYKVKSQITLERVIKNEIDIKDYSKAEFKRMTKVKKKFNITPTGEYYLRNKK